MLVLGNVASLSYFLPELILVVAALVVLLADIFSVEREGMDGTTVLTLLGLVLAFAAHIPLYSEAPRLLFLGMTALDSFSVFFKGFFILCGIITVLISIYSSELAFLKKGEYNSILLCIVLGMCLVASSVNLVMLYLSVELMSLGSYVLVGFAREGVKTREAAMKYILYGAVSTGVMLFGMSLLYGLTGTLSLYGESGIAARLAAGAGDHSFLLFTAMLLTLAGVGYKAALVPFHFWCPDVYEGAPTPITAFLSVASKATGFALLIRFYYQSLLWEEAGGVWEALAGTDWVAAICVLSAVTMTVGNLSALPQENMKRLLAYSGIAHAGYVLMGAAVLTTTGLEAMLFYLLMYLFTNLAVFTVVIILIDRAGIVEISQYAGLGNRNMPLAVILTICLLSLIGIPPTAGFIGKYYLFIAVINSAAGNAWFWALAIIAALNTVISCYYYFRILKAMFLEDAVDTEPIVPNRLYYGVACALTAMVLILFVFPGQAYQYVTHCTQLLQ